jgi:hypothetical protein
MQAIRRLGSDEGAIAQLEERLPCTQEVSGSIPLGSIAGNGHVLRRGSHHRSGQNGPSSSREFVRRRNGVLRPSPPRVRFLPHCRRGGEEDCRVSPRQRIRDTVTGVRTKLIIAFVAFRFLLFPVSIVLLLAVAFLPIGIGGHTLRTILIVLWVLALIPSTANLVHTGWKKWSAR